MVKIDDLRRLASSRTDEGNREQEAKNAAYAAQALWRVESEPGAVALLFTAAILDSRIEDFPGVVPLEHPNGHLSGFSLRRTPQGAWHMHADHGTLLRFHSGLFKVAAPRYDAFLKAMGIPHSREAIETVRGFATFGPDGNGLATQIGTVAAKLARHVLSAALSSGQSLGGGLETGALRLRDHAATFVKAIAATGVDLNGREGVGRSPLAALAAQGDVPFLRELLAAGADPNHAEGEAILAAFAGGRQEAAECLIARGADASAARDDDETVLHKAVLSRDSNVQALVELALRARVDPGIRNFRGEDAADVARRLAEEESAKKGFANLRDCSADIPLGI